MRQLLIACAKSCDTTGATNFITSFGIPSGPRAFPLGSLQIVSSSSSLVTLLLIGILYSIGAAPIVSLRSAWPVFGKNFSERIWTFWSLSLNSGSLIVLLRAGRWGSPCGFPAFRRLHLDSVQSPVDELAVNSSTKHLQLSRLTLLSSFLRRFERVLWLWRSWG